MSQSLLSLTKVVKKRPGGRGYELNVQDLRLTVNSRVALVGDSGSGKSTLLDLAALILKPDKASGFFWRPQSPSAVDLFRAWEKKEIQLLERIRREELGYVTQTGGLLPFLSVKDNILLPTKLKKIPKKKALVSLYRLAEELKIVDLLAKIPSKLSVGQRQRVAIARALAHQPSLILADEPTASLDPPTARQALDLLLTLSHSRALIVSTHNLDLIKDQGFLIYKVECGTQGPDQPVIASLVGPLDFTLAKEGFSSEPKRLGAQSSP
ncbi:MAG: ABC transporter ATP-binding protein [Deltaproteobacteria bacterium]|jgi:putative ABC transport system ATP-binding protein|nr:ABC transporter ATP-binding protein [Deltaproteobacteria bacterium]